MKEVENHIESIITRKISDQISADEQQILDSWLATNAENDRYFHHLEKIYTQATNNKADDLAHIDIDQEWHKFKNNIKTEKANSTLSKSWLRIAASITVIATLGYLIWINAFHAESTTVLAQYSGQIITLPDSSVVTLNKNASITFPDKFNSNKRKVKLTGEAFFEVARNVNKPFVVNLGLSNVEVLGTSFNIDATEGNRKIEIVVNTGKVKFINTITKESVILSTGEKGMLMKNNNLISKAQNNNVNFMAWRTRKIIFKDIELDDVIQTLNKLYEAQITFSTDVGKNCKVSVSFDNQSLDSILSVLELTLDLEYKKEGDIIEVVKAGC